jgi:hypothetical protein
MKIKLFILTISAALLLTTGIATAGGDRDDKARYCKGETQSEGCKHDKSPNSPPAPKPKPEPESQPAPKPPVEEKQPEAATQPAQPTASPSPAVQPQATPAPAVEVVPVFEGK